MEIKHLREFIIMSNMCSYNKAAKALFISQSSLFKHMRAIEEEIGAPLFERVGKNVALNEFGQKFLIYANKVVDLTDKFITDLTNYHDISTGTIYIGAQYKISDLVTEFRRENRQYMIRVIDGGTPEDFFQRNGCEVAFLRDFHDDSGSFDSFEFSKDYKVLITPNTHPLAGRTDIAPEELYNEDFIAVSNSLTEKNPGLGDLSASLGFIPRVAMTTGLGSEAIRLVALGAGISVVVRNTISKDALKDISICNTIPNSDFTVYLVWRKDIPLSEGAKQFIDFIRSKKQTENTNG